MTYIKSQIRKALINVAITWNFGRIFLTGMDIVVPNFELKFQKKGGGPWAKNVISIRDILFIMSLSQKELGKDNFYIIFHFCQIFMLKFRHSYLYEFW
jgi:hypothetical protein